MKFFYLCFSILPFFISCSDSTHLNRSDSSASDSEFVSFARGTDTVLPLNKNNPYDAVGQLHNEILEVYFASDTLPSSVMDIAARVDSLSKLNKKFVALGSNYKFKSFDRVNYIISHADSCSTTIIVNSLDTFSAKKSLLDFTDSLLSLCEREDDYAFIYDSIVGYEASVLKNDLFSERDKRVLLTTTSIARHSVYLRKKKPKKNKDSEWDYLVTKIAAASDGATIGMQESVMRALIVGIAKKWSVVNGQ